ESFEVAATRGRAVYPRGLRQPRGVGLLGQVVARGAPLRVADRLADPRTWRRDLAGRTQVRSWLGVPLADRAGMLGVLTLLRDTVDPFADEDEHRLTALAALAAAAIREARLY